jgi:hypothetical protein
LQRDAEIMAIFQAGNASRAPRQVRGGGPWASADFQNVFSKIRTLKRPWKPPAFCKVLPQSRSTEPIFKAIHAVGDRLDDETGLQHYMKSPQGRGKLVGIV